MQMRPLILEPTLGYDATGAAFPVLQIHFASVPSSTRALVTLQLAVALGHFLGADTAWSPAIDLQRGAIALERCDPAATETASIASLAAFIDALRARRGTVLA